MFPHEGGDEEESLNGDQLAALETMLDENDEEDVEVIREVEEIIDQVNTNIEEGKGEKDKGSNLTAKLKNFLSKKLGLLVEKRKGEGKGGKPKGDELSPGSSSQSNCDGGDVPTKGVVGPSKGVVGPVKGVNEGGNSCLEKVKNAVKEDNLSTTDPN